MTFHRGCWPFRMLQHFSQFPFIRRNWKDFFLSFTFNRSMWKKFSFFVPLHFYTLRFFAARRKKMWNLNKFTKLTFFLLLNLFLYINENLELWTRTKLGRKRSVGLIWKDEQKLFKLRCFFSGQMVTLQSFMKFMT